MPPPTGGKRKRGDRSYSGDSFSRPSPHRPERLSLAQGAAQSPSNGRDYNDNRSRGGRRPSRGGRGAVQPPSPNNPRHTPDTAPTSTESPAPQPDTTVADTKMTTEPSDLTMTTAKPAVPLPYTYNFVTDEMCEAWNDQGRQRVLEQATAAMDAADEAKTDILLQELLQSALSGRLDPSATGDLVKDILEYANENAGNEDQGSQIPGIQASVTDAISIAHENNPAISLDRLAQFLTATTIPPDFLRHGLDQELLLKLEMIRTTFKRIEIRKATNLLYRQANFNLIREESEGFAKLITELFTTSGHDHPSGSHVEESVEKVKALIGAFDLDVGRSLDVVLDVFGAVLVKQFRFFVKFLRTSPWWPRHDTGTTSPKNTDGLPLWALPGVEEWYLLDHQKELIAQEMYTRDRAFWKLARQEGLRSYYQIGLSSAEDPSALQKLEDDFSKAWVAETGARPPSGNSDAAQLLGFKLRFYSSSPVRDEHDILPDHLVYLSALLIKIGFISLKDLYPHLWRDDAEMSQLRKQKEKEKEERERAARPGAETLY
jgi:THO complex subunit 2